MFDEPTELVEEEDVVAQADELKWTHFGVRPLAMGNAFVAVADLVTELERLGVTIHYDRWAERDDVLALAVCRAGRDLSAEEIARFQIGAPRFNLARRQCPPRFSWER